MKIFDIVIIGAGPAGMTCAIYAKRSNKSVLLIDQYAPGGRIRSTYQVDNYLGFGRVSAEELVSKMINHLHDVEIQEAYGFVNELKKTNDLFEIKTDDEVIYSKSVVVASGTKPKKLNIPNETELLSKGISYCAVCDAMFFQGEDVAMIGGGDSALEEALYLSGICRKVYLIHDLPYFTASKSIVEKLKTKENIIIYNQSKVEKFNGSNQLESIDICINKEAKKNIPCSGAFIYCGSEANTSFLKDADVCDQDGFINVSPEMQTTVLGLFACGDVIKKDYRFIATAISDGAIAAMSANRYVEKISN